MSLSPSLKYQIGRQIRRYTLVELLGHGSFGAVYRANTLSTPVAVKITEHRKIAEDESEILLTLQGSPGVPQWLWFGQDLSHHVLVMTIGYKNIDEMRMRLKDRGYTYCRLTLLRILTQATQILQMLHSKHIVHRDIKCNNYMITVPEGPMNTVKLILIDFGLATMFENEEKLPIDMPDMYLGGRVHSTPAQNRNDDHSPADDFLQLSYCTFHLQNIRKQDVMGSRKDQWHRYKNSLVRDPETVLPNSLMWLLPFFKMVAEQDEILPVDCDKILESIRECNNGYGDVAGEMTLVKQNGELKLF